MGKKSKPGLLSDSELDGVAGGVGPLGEAEHSARPIVTEERAPPPALVKPPPGMREQGHFDDTFGLTSRDAATLRADARAVKAPELPAPKPSTLSKEQILSYLNELSAKVSNPNMADPMALRDSLIASLNAAQNAAFSALDLKGGKDSDVGEVSDAAQAVMVAIQKKIEKLDQDPAVQTELGRRINERIGKRPSTALVVQPNLARPPQQTQEQNALLQALLTPSAEEAPRPRFDFTKSSRAQIKAPMAEANQDLASFFLQQPGRVQGDLAKLKLNIPEARTPFVSQFLRFMGIASSQGRSDPNTALMTLPKTLTREEANRQIAAFFAAQDPKLVAKIQANLKLDIPEAQKGFVGQFLKEISQASALEGPRQLAIEEHSDGEPRERAPVEARPSNARTSTIFFEPYSPDVQNTIAQDLSATRELLEDVPSWKSTLSELLAEGGMAQFHAWSLQKTFERAGSGLSVMEKQINHYLESAADKERPALLQALVAVQELRAEWSTQKSLVDSLAQLSLTSEKPTQVKAKTVITDMETPSTREPQMSPQTNKAKTRPAPEDVFGDHVRLVKTLESEQREQALSSARGEALDQVAPMFDRAEVDSDTLEHMVLDPNTLLDEIRLKSKTRDAAQSILQGNRSYFKGNETDPDAVSVWIYASWRHLKSVEASKLANEPQGRAEMSAALDSLKANLRTLEQNGLAQTFPEAIKRLKAEIDRAEGLVREAASKSKPASVQVVRLQKLETQLDEVTRHEMAKGGHLGPEPVTHQDAMSWISSCSELVTELQRQMMLLARKDLSDPAVREQLDRMSESINHLSQVVNDNEEGVTSARESEVQGDELRQELTGLNILQDLVTRVKKQLDGKLSVAT